MVNTYTEPYLWIEEKRDVIDRPFDGQPDIYFIESELGRFEGMELEHKKDSASTEALDDLFRTSLHAVWHEESKRTFTK